VTPPLRVLAVIHMAPPHHNAGAEMMIHTLLRHLVRNGHEVRVLLSRTPEREYVHEGVTYSRGVTRHELARWFRWCTVAVTHLDLTRTASSMAIANRKPLAHIVHNDRQLAYHRVTPRPGVLAVFNSEWIADSSAWAGESVVVRPPVVAEDYRTTPGECLTLVNLSLSKGAEVFYDLARRLPDHRFLGVRGSYAQQVVPAALPGNVTIRDNTPAMRDVYGATRVLLMPSDYESWGRVAVEAAASGIPTIAHPTPGLRESLGPAGIFADRADPDAWAEAIRRLDKPTAYKKAAAASRARSLALDPVAECETFERSLQGLVDANL